MEPDSEDPKAPTVKQLFSLPVYQPPIERSPITGVTIRLNGRNVASYKFDDRNEATPAERRMADRTIAEEIGRLLNTAPGAVDTGNGEIVDVDVIKAEEVAPAGKFQFSCPGCGNHFSCDRELIQATAGFSVQEAIDAILRAAHEAAGALDCPKFARDVLALGHEL